MPVRRARPEVRESESRQASKLSRSPLLKLFRFSVADKNT
jgi:hypothetical protein